MCGAIPIECGSCGEWFRFDHECKEEDE